DDLPANVIVTCQLGIGIDVDWTSWFNSLDLIFLKFFFELLFECEINGSGRNIFLVIFLLLIVVLMNLLGWRTLQRLFLDKIHCLLWPVDGGWPVIFRRASGHRVNMSITISIMNKECNKIVRQNHKLLFNNNVMYCCK
uniref:Uncharacterized protein n=1 Tax=Glossina palpalis gambiensis TaxID=67801 RepID=A0A1B0BUJ1_9MUSC